MKVKELSELDPATCRPQESLERAAQIMWDRDCGCVPVVDDEHRPIGMITDRDVTMAAYTRGQALCDVPIDAVMAREVRCCRAMDPVDVAHQRMREHQVRRLPVVDELGVLVGVVSLADLVRASELDGAAAARRNVADEVLATYQAVSRPRSAPQGVLVPKAKARPRGAGAKQGAKRA
jgi:CBS domain-containing protein